MMTPSVIDEKLSDYFKKYLSKPSNEGRIFRPSMTVVEKETLDDSGDELGSDDKEVVDTEFRKCQVARDTSTLQKLYTKLEETVDAAADRFIEKYQYFSLASTKEDYTLQKFEAGDFHREHVECTGLNDKSDGSSRRLAVYMILQAPEKGGVFNFAYQGVKIRPEEGSLIVFPSCPLHPVEITRVQKGNLLMIVNYIL